MFIKIDKKVRQNEGSLECKQTLTNFFRFRTFFGTKIQMFLPKKSKFYLAGKPQRIFYGFRHEPKQIHQVKK